MSVYPYDLDDDTTIIRVDDNVTEIAGQNFNQVRDAVFKIELELGIKPAGTNNNLKEFLDVAHNQDGTIKGSALAAVGLVTLPIDNVDIGVNAGIVESKLMLDYSTNTLKLLIEGNAEQICSIRNATDLVIARLNKHIGGGPEAELRHVLSHIDVNAIPFDTRDVNFSWDGLKNTLGGLRSVTHLGEALEQINDELVEHQLATNPTFSHPATSISIDTSNFSEIPSDVNDVQEAIEALDASEETRIGVHRAIMHSQGIPPDARASVITKPDIEEEQGTLPDGYLDGYGTTVVVVRESTAYQATTGGVTPVDSTLNGDDVVAINTPADDADKYKLDSEFVLVKPGDIARINYGNGLEGTYIVESVRFIPGIQWAFRINGNNLANVTDAYVRIDRPIWDTNIWGVAAAAVSNAFPTESFSGFLGSVIVSDPRSAVALGVGFDANQLDSTHYLLHLEVYPNGNPKDKVITIPGIDVTGNQGTTPGDYTLESVIQATNNGLRAAGVNARFIAFEYKGNFGITMADAINGVSFAVLTGEKSGSNVIEGSYANNVVGDARSPVQDALGLGANGSDFASPAFSTDDFADSVIALKPTKVLMPRKRRFYVADGSRRDFLRSALSTENDEIIDGYWIGTITDRIPVPGITVKTEYTIEKNLKDARLFPGKTITVQPLVDFGDALYHDADYGRFIIESVQYIPPCPGDPEKTILTVINGVHANSTSNPEGSSTGPTANLQVAIHFDNSSVGFSQNNMVDLAAVGRFHRLHEIYATSESTTFSHERLRMPVQTAAGALLDTESWRVRAASPKLRGFTDNNTTLNRFVRLYILSYDSTTGEYDGYLGQRDIGGNLIFNTGPVTRGRKGQPIRFYDNTGLDYIEVEFLERSTNGSPTTVQAPAYVDIEVFPSLELNDELLLLATCEVNWQTPATQIVERLIDRREVGSVSEEEFTQSAKSFIQAADRHLHANGIIRGFDIKGEDPDDSTSILFNGGVAFVNGVVVYANNAKVRIPNALQSGDSAPASIDWAICINEYGNFVSIPVTPTKEQFFLQDPGGGDSWFVDSATFQELATTRKDLVVVAFVDATIQSVTIDAVSDARKFVENETLDIPLSWTSEEQTGNFRTLTALKTWINNIRSTSSFVKIKGEFNIDTTVNLSDLNFPVVFEGDNATINVATDKGITVGSDQIWRNITFNYNPVGSTFDVVEDRINFVEKGCLHRKVDIGNNIKNFTIENCKFISSANTQRGPFISIELRWSANATAAAYARNIKIRDNEFEDNGTTKDNCAIAIVGTADSKTVNTHPYLETCIIQDNHCRDYQSIVVASGASSRSVRESTDMAVKLVAANTNIRNNKAGAILVRVQTSSDVPSIAGGFPQGIVIDSNSTYAISALADAHGNRDNFGSSDRTVHTDRNDTELGPNNLSIVNNNSIQIEAGNATSKDSTAPQPGVNISGNHLQGNNTGLVSPWLQNDGSDGLKSAIYVRNKEGFENVGSCIISNNTIGYGPDGGGYDFGINCIEGAFVVNGNAIAGLEENAIGIDISVLDENQSVVNNNTIYREPSINIERYIDLGNSQIICVGNNFNSPFINSAEDNFNSIEYGNQCLVMNNLNNRFKFQMLTAPFSLVDSSRSTLFTKPSNLSSMIVTGAKINPLFLSSGTTDFVYQVDLASQIPPGSKIIEIEIFYKTESTLSNAFEAGSEIVFRLISLDEFSTFTINSNTLDLTTLTPDNPNIANGSIVWPIDRRFSPNNDGDQSKYLFEVIFDNIEPGNAPRSVELYFNVTVEF